LAPEGVSLLGHLGEGRRIRMGEALLTLVPEVQVEGDAQPGEIGDPAAAF